MIEIPIGIDSNGNMVYVRVMELDQKFGVLNNKKIAMIQTEIIKEARIKLAKQKGAIVFWLFFKVHFEPFYFSKITLNILLKSVKI